MILIPTNLISEVSIWQRGKMSHFGFEANLYTTPDYWKELKKEKYLEEIQIIYEHLKDGNDY